MKILSSKKIVMRGGNLRLIAVLCCAIGILAVWNWQPEPEPAVFRVHLQPEVPSQETIFNNILEARDLSKYDSGGSFYNCRGSSKSELKQCEKEIDEGRNFIFNHLKNKKRGYIIHEWSGVDNGGEYHIFIEPDENGDWQVIVRSESFFSYEIVSKIAVSIERKQKSEANFRPRAGKFYLSFLDKNGKKIFIL